MNLVLAYIAGLLTAFSARQIYSWFRSGHDPDGLTGLGALGLAGLLIYLAVPQ